MMRIGRPTSRTASRPTPSAAPCGPPPGNRLRLDAGRRAGSSISSTTPGPSAAPCGLPLSNRLQPEVGVEQRRSGSSTVTATPSAAPYGPPPSSRPQPYALWRPARLCLELLHTFCCTPHYSHPPPISPSHKLPPSHHLSHFTPHSSMMFHRWEQARGPQGFWCTLWTPQPPSTHPHILHSPRLPPQGNHL